MRNILHIDIETYCDLNLAEVGVHIYAAHPSFSLLLVGWAVDDSPVEVITGEEFLHRRPMLLKALTSPEVIKVAHNAAFEFTCLSNYLNLQITQWEDTQVMCAQLGLPRPLELASQVLGVTEKDKEGKRLIRLFSMPNRGKRIMPQDRPKDWQMFIDYNRIDVEAERDIYKKLSKFGMDEKQLFELDHKINKRGVRVDTRLAKNAIEISGYAYAAAYEKLMAVTGLERPTDNAIKAKYGVSTLVKKEIQGLVKERPELAEILALRGQLAKTSIKKYEAMLACASPADSRARGLTAFYGAGRTGRWAGRLVQLQNLPRIGLSDEELAFARDAALTGDTRLYSLLYGDAQLNNLSQLIRTALVPAPGHKFIVADFSAIEARVLAWISGEQWRLDVFNGDGRIYETSAERMFGLPSGSVTKSSPLRQKGKIAELALGYGGAVGALINMGALDMGLTEDELPKLVRMWRNANPAITRFWKGLDELLEACLYNRPANISHPFVRVRRDKGPLQIELPNGRRLTYQAARWEAGETRYMGMSQTTNKWELQDLYGAKATENVVQAIARDCLAEVIIYAEEKGYNPVFHVHDEIICEVPEADAVAAYEDVMARMAKLPSWAPGLPIKGDGFICDYYSK
jgi:DNA polymerase